MLLSTPLITNDAVTFGVLASLLGLIFYTAGSDHPFWKRFYRFVPPLLLCYFLPAIAVSSGLIDDPERNLYFVASRYLLPAALVLLTLNIDFSGIARLGPKALIMFLAASLGVVMGGPLALLLVSALAPDFIGGDPDQVWRGLATVAGSWIGGGANQTAMKEIYQVGDEIFASMVVVDVIVYNSWMAVLLYGAGIANRIDRWMRADNRAIRELEDRLAAYRQAVSRMPGTRDYFLILAVGFGATGLAHWGADLVVPLMERSRESLNALGLNALTSGFFWMIVLATTIGLLLSLTPVRKLEGVGASRFGTLFIYLLVTTIGMQMNLLDIFSNLHLIFIGVVWMLIHVLILLVVGRLVRAPFFFTAVGSMANVGGAASAPVVASAFSASLAPVGVLLAVLGYALGTYGAILCAEMMRLVVMG